MKTNTKDNVVRMAQMGMLAAIAIVLVTVTQFPIIPAAPFMKYDMADVPILLGTRRMDWPCDACCRLRRSGGPGGTIQPLAQQIP